MALWKMKHRSTVHWIAMIVFVLLGKASQCDGTHQMKEDTINTLTFYDTYVTQKNYPQQEGNVQIKKAVVDEVEHSKKKISVEERSNGFPGSIHDVFVPVNLILDFSFKSSNSCQISHIMLYLSQEKKITIFAEQTVFNWAISDAQDLNGIMNKIKDFENLELRGIQHWLTVTFFLNKSGTEMRDITNQQHAIFRYYLTINNTRMITKIPHRHKTFWSSEKPRNVSLKIRSLLSKGSGEFNLRNIGKYINEMVKPSFCSSKIPFRLLLSKHSGEFNIRNIVEDINEMVKPSFCSSKIPFFYSLVISGKLKSNSLFVIFISFNYTLSCCSLLLIFLTAKFSQQWRQRRSNIILINFTMSIFSQIILHFVSDFSGIDEGLCSTITILCHYFTLVQFFWTSVIAYMQYRRYVQVFNEKNGYFLTKLIIFAWFMPIIIIFASLVLVFSIHKNATICIDKFKMCSLINTYLLKYSVSLPLMFTLLINFIFFILIFQHLLRKKTEIYQRSALLEVKLAFVLFFLLDLNLIVAIIADMFNVDILALIFVTSHSLQGVLLFVVFVVRNKCSRKMYIRWLKMMKNRISLPI
ncbi:uncharacterized protein LOC123684099 isoform X2 [Harmonia axyridis]|uniref:uncharacterized protein LOC123684099 isoform X2 n=1 Tax=Harmonia axyridis TaxID=115357 RepID=UPI001E2758A2|nr:uncharacterized protein LOC123684099 isoform X2 [Harmonia axyridis]